MSDSSLITKELYDKVEKSLKNKDTLKTYKDTIDKYLAINHDKYFSIGPLERPIFSTTSSDNYIELVGLTREEISKVLKKSKAVGSGWYIMNNPFNVANVLATRYFLITKNPEFVKFTQWYLIVSFYPSIHFKYFKYGVNEACMTYTVNNLSGKYRIKQEGNLWNIFTKMMETMLELHEKNLIKGDDKAFVRYIQDAHTRINSLIQNIASEYYDNYENQRFLSTEHESFEEDDYYEADSNSYAIERITNKVVTSLVVNGPDMKLVEMSAKMNDVSVNQLRNYVSTMINEKQRDDIKKIVEALLFLFLFNKDGETHSPRDVGTNDFLIYCLKVYKKSNTNDDNIKTIKTILDKWLVDLGLLDKTTNKPTINNFRKALFTFFVMTIQKAGK